MENGKVAKMTKVATIAMLLVAVIALPGCSTTQYVPVESVKIDTCYIKQLERDSIYVKDSVFVRTVADTVFHTRVQWKLRDRIVRDTVYRIKCDTVSRVVKVEKELTSWERTKMSVGGYAIVCGAILVAVWFAKRLKGL